MVNSSILYVKADSSKKQTLKILSYKVARMTVLHQTVLCNTRSFTQLTLTLT